MRTLTPSAFVLECLGGMVSGRNLKPNSNLIAHVMRKIFTAPSATPNDEYVVVGVPFYNLDYGIDATGIAVEELFNGEADLVNGQNAEAIIGDILQMYLLPIARPGVSQAQIRLNTAFCDTLISHLIYFGYWYRMDHYSNDLH